MQILKRRRKSPSLSWFAGWILTGGLSAMACSGGVEAEGAPDTEQLPLENEMPAAMQGERDNGGDGGELLMEAPGMSMEGNPDPAGLDGSNDTDSTGQDDGGDQDEDVPMMSMAEETLLVPDTEHCAAVSDWDPEWVQFEEEVLLLVNERRAETADCGVEGTLPPVAPVAMDPILRCSARLHSLDMFEREFFDHTNPDGVDPFVRMADAGFSGSSMGENIAGGQVTPEQVMQSWMDSDGHCANVMRSSFTLIGVGFHPGAGLRGIGSNYWTQNFGAPRMQGRRPL